MVDGKYTFFAQNANEDECARIVRRRVSSWIKEGKTIGNNGAYGKRIRRNTFDENEKEQRPPVTFKFHVVRLL